MSLPDYDAWLEKLFQQRCHDEDFAEMDEMDCENETDDEDDDEPAT